MARFRAQSVLARSVCETHPQRSTNLYPIDPIASISIAIPIRFDPESCVSFSSGLALRLRLRLPGSNWIVRADLERLSVAPRDVHGLPRFEIVAVVAVVPVMFLS